MTLRKLSREQLGAELGYVNGEGSARATAELLREPLRRWGLSPKRALLRHAREQLRACGVEDVSEVPQVLQRLISLGECEEVRVGHEPYIAPAPPRWISVGEGTAVFLGVSQPPHELSIAEGDQRDILRRVVVEEEEDLAALEIAGALEVSLSRWLVPLDYHRLASRRLHRASRSDELSLSGYWGVLEEALVSEGLTLSDDAEVRFVGGRPGDYFGDYRASLPEGRWTTDPEPGVWCAYRRGYGDSHWHPCVVAVDEEGMRSLDLYDADEWRWALLARGHSVGVQEVVKVDGRSVRLTFPAPVQLRAAMDILGYPGGAWTWEAGPAALELLGLLVEVTHD